MDGSDSVWICLSDLLAGIMAFFVFVSAGIYVDYLGMENLAFDNSEQIILGADEETGLGENPDLIGDGIFLQGDSMFFALNFFKKNKRELTEEQKEGLGAFRENAERLLAVNGKILIVGHASCDCGITDAALTEQLLEMKKLRWDELDPSRQAEERYKALNAYNSEIAIDRAYALFEYLWDSSDIIRQNKRNNIRYIGLSEQMAASKLHDVKCRDRNRPTSDGNIIECSAQVFFLDEWPSLVGLAEKTTTHAR